MLIMGGKLNNLSNLAFQWITIHIYMFGLCLSTKRVCVTVLSPSFCPSFGPNISHRPLVLQS